MKTYVPPLLALFADVSLIVADTPVAKTEAPARQAAYVVPEKTADGWEIGNAADVGLDLAPVNELLERIKDESYKNLHSMLVVRKGRLIVEQYFTGTNSENKKQTFTRDTLHTLQSCTKSVNSILIGIAIDQHLIHRVDEKISTFFPDEADLFADEKKDAILLKHCLSMTAGLAWNESGIPYTDPRNDAYGLNRSDKPVRYVFERSVADPPRTKFLYHSGISIALGEVLHHASKMKVTEFAEKHLFGPLGIKNYHWAQLPSGATHTGGGLWLRPRDMAKIGLLYLNHGRWQGKQIVSEDWVRDSTKQQAPYRGYGYQWWLRSFRGRDREISAFAAQGLGGQFIVVIPDLDMVAVFTGWNIGALTEQPFDMLQRFLVPAVAVP